MALAPAALLVACVALAFPAGGAAQVVGEGAAPEPTALEVAAPGQPRFVYGSDGREHVDYDLAITDAFTAEVTLKSLTVTVADRELLRLSGESLAAHTHQIIAGQGTSRIAASATVVTLVDVVLPRSAGQHVPRRLTNRLDYTLPQEAPRRAAIGSTTVTGPVLRTERRDPIVISSPVHGSGWVSANGCCDDPASPHRNLVLSANGTYVTPELFDIDWTQVVNGSLFDGAGTKLSDYPSFGAPIYAVANGTVLSTIDDRPEVPPGRPSGTGNPTVRKPKDFGGNEIIEKIGRGLYAAYEHLQTGSIIVKPGQRLRTGQPIARLGNTGNTTAPHLHFGIHDGPSILSSDSLPFVIGNWTLAGYVGLDTTPSHVVITGPSQSERRSYPLITSVATFDG